MRAARISLLLLAGFAACQEAPPPPSASPELILVGGTIHVDPDAVGEGAPPSAIALQGGRVLAVGSDEEIRALAAGGTTVEELDGELEVADGTVGEADLRVSVDAAWWIAFLGRERGLVPGLLTGRLRLRGGPGPLRSMQRLCPV